jgi:hypothetical protein
MPNLYISQDIIDFDHDSLDNPFCDPETAAKTLISVHYQYRKNEGELDLIDDILNKISKYIDGGSWVLMNTEFKNNRQALCNVAKDLIERKHIGFVEAIQLLFTLEEMEIYGY